MAVGGVSGAEYLETVEGEICFFRAMMRTRPVGVHRHFHVLNIHNTIWREANVKVSIDDIWAKLRSCYNLDILESFESEGYPDSVSGDGSSTGASPPEDKDRERLSSHPFFRRAFSPPHDEDVDALIAARRIRTSSSPAATESAAPSPAPAPPPVRTRGRKRALGRDTAGLVGGDSDSSALTQESGDESVAPTPRGSVVTVTDAGTEEAEDEEESEAPESPAPRKAQKGTKRTTAAARTRATTAAANTSRLGKKRKR